MRFYARRGKRLLDVVASAIGLIVLAPLFALVAIVVRAHFGRPVLFRQERPGLNGNLFTILKFRTMRVASDARGMPLADAERLTKTGRFLRATSLDELPELWNVLCGDMSLVGPRPLLTRYIERYSRHQARRHEVRPGITGWAQINGRNALSWEQKFDHDVWYVDHLTFRLDAKILIATVAVALSGRGVSAPGEATAAEFMGSLDANGRRADQN